MGNVGAAYAGCRQRIGELVAGLDGDSSGSGSAGAAARVPTCPSWTVHDVVAHLAGVVDDALAGRLDGVATDPWTAAQVEAGRGRPVADLLAQWNEQAPAFEGLLDDIGPPGRQAVFDAVTHEHDIRGALGRPGARDSDAVAIGVGFLAPALVSFADTHGIGLRIVTTEGDDWGPANAAVTLRTDRFELLRAGAGRRSESQLAALHWDGDGRAVLPAFTYGPFRPPVEAVEE